MSNTCKFAIMLVVLCVSTGSVVGQIANYDNFIIEEGELIYQKVFDTAIVVDDARDYYLSRPKIKNIEIYEDFILGDFEKERIDTRKYGKRWANTPILFNNFAFSGKVRIDFKDDRYRLTVFGVKMISLNTRVFGDSDLSSDALKKNRTEIRPSYASEDMLGLFHLFFIDSFSIKNTKKAEW